MTESTGWRSDGVDENDALFDQLASLPADSPEREAVRDRLIELNLPLVKHVARRYATWNLPLDDAVQIGSLGLIKAVDSFDPTLGHRFGAYAVPKIMGEIRRFLRDSNWLIRVPRRTHELQGAVAHARDALTQELGRPPAISEIAERIGATAAEVVEVVESFRIREGRSLDAADPHEAPDAEIQAAVAFDERGFEASELTLDLREAMEGLTDVEREVVAKRFGSGMSQSEIAAEIGVSQMQVSRVLRRSLDRMRRRLSE